ncbi:MAG TPA: aldehyde dehydrogenase family protein [Acidimicrobiia bacterium]|nr:aldehyde dehydrogenase family protein [Acidimicrobiia bacterium]
MDTARIDADMAVLDANKKTWATLPISRKIRYLDSIKAHTVRVAREWVVDAVHAKGVSIDAPIAGEEWTGGPYSVLSIIQDLRSTLVRLDNGESVLDGYEVRELPSGQVTVDVFPRTSHDRLLFSGISAEVRMQPDVTLDNLDATVATFYREADPSGAVGVVLAAGNIASIAVLDVVHAMFNEGKVAVLKMNPVNDYLGSHFEEILADLIADGFVRLAYGGADVGSYLTSHPLAETIHITGSASTYEAIVFGTGDEGRRNKEQKTVVNPRPVGAELGGVGPVIVVPGKWTKRDIRFQAEHIVSMKMHNAGFNCVAAQVLVLPEGWDHKGALIDEIRAVLAEIDDRPPYYPGAEDRCERVASVSRHVEVFGDTHDRFLLLEIDPEDTEHPAFRSEVFGPALAVTTLPCPDVPSYLIKAARFANGTLEGTLGAVILIDPRTRRRYDAALERALDDLEYGTIAVNAWTGAAYFLSAVAWGAYPGHTPDDIGSGVGFVHNVLMFDRPQKSIVRAPFAPSHRGFLRGEFHLGPKMVYFVTNKQAHNIGFQLIAYSDEESMASIAKVASAAIRG